MKRRLLSTALLLAGAALSACSSAPTRFYTIDALAPQTTSGDYRGPSYRIDAVHIPATLDRPELVQETAADRLTVHDQEHWAAPLGDLLRRALTEDLAARLPSGKVIFPDLPKSPGSGGVVVDILAISPTGDGAVMDVSWTLMTPPPAPAPAAAGPQATPPAAIPPPPAPTADIRRRTMRLTSLHNGGGINAIPMAFSKLMDELAEAIAADLRTDPPS